MAVGEVDHGLPAILWPERLDESDLDEGDRVAVAPDLHLEVAVADLVGTVAREVTALAGLTDRLDLVGVVTEAVEEQVPQQSLGDSNRLTGGLGKVHFYSRKGVFTDTNLVTCAW